MITQQDLETRGWSFDALNGEAWLNGALAVRVASDIPLFALIRAANHVEGDDELLNDMITPDLVAQVSGETWTPPTVTPTVATSTDADDVAASIVSQNLAANGVTSEALPTAFQTLLGEAKSAIPFFEKYALDPSMTSPQWAAFQALDQATKDRLLYDVVRSLAALMRYLTGDLPAGS